MKIFSNKNYNLPYKLNNRKMKKFWIMERHNPQFEKPYYRAHGQLFKKDARQYEDTVYGRNVMLSYDTKGQYEAAIAKFKADGFTVYLD